MRNKTCFTRFNVRILAVAMGAALASPVSATNGYFSNGYGTQSKAMGGTGVALSLDSLAPATNPAALMGVDDRIDFGIAYFSPDRGYEVTGGPSGACMSATQCTFGIGPQSLSSDKNMFLIPHFGISRRLGDDAAIGVAVYGNGGMNTRYVGGSATFGVPMGTVPPGVPFTLPGTFGNGTAGVDMLQLFVAPTYARRFDNGVSVGISPIFAMQLFEARGLGNFAPFSSAPTKLTDNHHDKSYGMGLRLGVQAPLGESLRFGASYQTQIRMSSFDSYAGLFAEQGDFDIPATATIGLSARPSEALTLAFDVQWIGYSDIASVGNPLLPNLMIAPLGSDNGAGFGWENMTIYKFGAAWKTSDRDTWRFGFSTTDQPIRPSEVLFNILAPGVVEKHFTVGYTRKIEGGNEWSLAGTYAPTTSVRGPNPLDPAQTIELSMDQIDIEFSYSFQR